MAFVTDGKTDFPSKKTKALASVDGRPGVLLLAKFGESVSDFGLRKVHLRL